MSFCSFSKDFTANMYTSVENQFITKYLPQADGDAVRVYLFGLYLCQCAQDFDAANMGSVLKLSPKKLDDIFTFWEECDLIHVLSRNPLLVEYLPVNSAVGKPKPIRPEKYAQFNRELYKILQKANKDFKPYEIQRILEFLENRPMEPQAFLLVAEYCAKKDGEKLSAQHMLNKAEKLCKEHKYTYEQVEQDLNDFNVHEREMSRIFTLLGIYRKPQEEDFDFLQKWLSEGFDFSVVALCAGKLKKGTVYTLDSLLSELAEKEARTKEEAAAYLERREELVSVVYAVARRLGLKIQNPRPYVETYAEKWLEHGYESDSLTMIASLGLKLGYGFEEMNDLLDKLYRDGVVDSAGVKEYCAARDKQLKMLQSIQSVLGVVKKTQAALDMIEIWRSWNFSDEMILEAAKRSGGAQSPLPYMNKLLSEWKRLGIFTVSAIPENGSPARKFQSEAAIGADRRSDRERHYAVLRRESEARAESAQTRAMQDEEFKQADAAIRKGEIALARAEVYSPEEAETIKAQLQRERKKRAEALLRLRLSAEDLIPQYHCKKCSDTGFLPSGKACDCY